MAKEYDSSWDLSEGDEGNLTEDEDAFDKKYEEWEKRDWPSWLKKNLVYPFLAKRTEDEDDAYFTRVAKHQPFRLGHTMEVIGLEPDEDDLRGLIVEVRERQETGYVPLADLEVASKNDRNYWPVREYAVWCANR